MTIYESKDNREQFELRLCTWPLKSCQINSSTTDLPSKASCLAQLQALPADRKESQPPWPCFPRLQSSCRVGQADCQWTCQLIAFSLSEYTCTHTQAHSWAHIRAHMCEHMCMYIHTCMHTYIHIYICLSICVGGSNSVFTNVICPLWLHCEIVARECYK